MRRLALLGLLALALPAAGTAAFPGTNGRLLFTQERQSFERDVPPSADLCVTTPSGARPTRVATAAVGQAIEDPAVAAAGDAVAYAKTGAIYVAAPDGTGERVLALGAGPAWAPDGSRLHYTRQGDLYSVRRDGSDQRQLTSGPRWDQPPAVSPGGRTIAYVRGPTAATADELVLVDASGGNERVLVFGPTMAAPDWAPDGSRLAFALGSALGTIRPDGTDYRLLATGGATNPAWSPDGALIAFERDGDIWTVPAAGGETVNVTRSPPVEREPAWQTGTAARAAGSDRPCAIVGTDASEILLGGPYDDVIYDLGGDDVVRAGGGDDVIYDGGGFDEHVGGDGDDRILLAHDVNSAWGGAGDDVISAAAATGPATSATTRQRLIGDAGDDVLTGGVAGDRIEGGAGDDVLNGNRGPDLLFGGPGNDRLAGNRGDDSLQGNQGNDVLYGGLISGFPQRYDGYDLLVGGEGDDRMAGGWQKDRLFGGPGNDRLAGGPHADHLVGESGIDILLGEQGDDLLLARDARRELVGGGPGFDRARVDRSDRRVGVERRIP